MESKKRIRPRTDRVRIHERVSPPIDPDAIVDEVAIDLVMNGKRPFSILHWEEEIEVWNRWWALQTTKKPDPPFYKVFGIEINHSRLLAGAVRAERERQQRQENLTS